MKLSALIPGMQIVTNDLICTKVYTVAGVDKYRVQLDHPTGAKVFDHLILREPTELQLQHAI